MACKPVCQLCKNFVISTAVTFTGGNVVITLPADRSYDDCDKVCIVVAQTIPEATTINAPVFIQIGDGAVLYPLTKCNCEQATACSIRTRTKYCTKIITSADTGTFRLLGNIPCAPNNRLRTLTGDGTPVTTAEGGN